MLVRQDGNENIYYICRDNLGSIVRIFDENGTEVYSASYDAWGNRSVSLNTIGFTRGYTAHEHLDEFGLINMNGRLYDPMLGRFFSPDNYVQMPDDTQSFNRYSYCLNNTLKYTDPDGESFVLATIIGAVIGTYMGGTIANGTYNPTKWDFSSPKTWGYMLSGGMFGAASGYIGASIASAGFTGSNTVGIMAASTVNSLGTYAYTLGETPISISAGVVSYDFTNGKFGYLGKKGNSKLDNWMYGLGALANVSDVLMGSHPQDVDLVTEHSDGTGHSALVETGTETGIPTKQVSDIRLWESTPDPNGIISVGPNLRDCYRSWHWKLGINSWDTHSRPGELIWRNTLKVNRGTINKYANHINSRVAEGKFHYSVEISSCVTHTSNALNLSGVFNIGIHPYLLNAQMYLWSNGIRPWTICNYKQ